MPTLKNSRKYDCEFTSKELVPIAADICSLYPVGSHQEDQAKRATFNNRLLPELKKLGIGGLMIQTPPVEKKHANPTWPKTTAKKIRDALARQPQPECEAEIQVEGCVIKRIGDDSQPVFFWHSQLVAVQPIPGAGIALAALLRDKHDQLDVDDHHRCLIVVNEGSRAHEKDVRDACAFIDFNQFPNFDRVYFVESPGRFSLVYDHEAWISMQAGKLPEDDELRALVASWMEARLSGSWPGALADALQICFDEGGNAWLTDGGRSLFEIEAHLFLKKCEWETPRRMWETFRGPVQDITDAQRKTAPVVPPPRK